MSSQLAVMCLTHLMARTIVALHAHPDDESSKGAGTIALYSDEAPTVLVTATGGEAGDILNPAADSPEARADLAAVRRSELRDAARSSDTTMLSCSAIGIPGCRTPTRIDIHWRS